MKVQVRALFLTICLSLGAADLSHAMSSLIAMSKEPVWPTSSLPDGTVVYSVTTVGRAGAGLLEVELTAGDMPPGVSVTFSPAVLRFTGNEVISQTATMTVFCSGLIPVDCFPFTITGTALREAISITNQVFYSAGDVANRPPTLMLDQLSGGALRVRGTGATGKTYRIETSSSLSAPVWTAVGSSTADGNGRFTFTSASAPGSRLRYFRAVMASE